MRGFLKFVILSLWVLLRSQRQGEECVRPASLGFLLGSEQTVLHRVSKLEHDR